MDIGDFTDEATITPMGENYAQRIAKITYTSKDGTVQKSWLGTNQCLRMIAGRS